MFDRKAYKAKGKQAFQLNYWLCVAVALIITLLCDGMLSGIYEAKDVPSKLDRGYEYFEGYHAEDGSFDYEMAIYNLPQSGRGAKSLTVVFGLLGIFVFSVVDVGGRRFFLNNSRGEGQFSDLLVGFQDGNYWKYVWSMFAIRLQVALWSLLLIIPGIIKAYEYAMVPYIVADNPGMDKKTAFAVSKQLMTGNKWNLFVFDLSFIGWNLLSLISLNIVGVFYVFPYIKSARAEVYLALKNGLDGKSEW